ncbi:MAG: UDP-N-acetylmuramoyl-tripeptide--D-alanyl-D-alanine ligase [Beutenbergiaceae bacterium]
MIELSVTDVAVIVGGAIGGSVAAASLSRVISSVVIDSRLGTAGSLFVALPGDQVDGHDYLHQAAAAGATAALVSRPVPDAPLPTVIVPDTATALAALAREVLRRLRHTGRIVVVGITGSVGKTSTKDLLSVMLAPLGDVVAPVASFNNEIGLPLTVLRADERTRVLILEMGADAPGNLTFLTSIAPPDVAVELIVGHAHLGGFGSIDGVARAKAELVQGLAPGGVAILNADDRRVLAMADQAARVVTFGRSAEADVRAEQVTMDADGHALFTLAAADQRSHLRLELVGEHQVTNALAAAAVSLHLGQSLAQIAQTLTSAGPISGHRMQTADTDSGIRVVDDSYNANPDSMRAGLAAVAAMSASGRRIVAVLGEMLDLGAGADDEHERIGALAVQLGFTEVVVVGSGAEPMFTAVEDAGGSGHFVDSVAAARSLLSTLLRPGDIVLVKASNGAGLTHLADWLTTDLELATA